MEIEKISRNKIQGLEAVISDHPMAEFGDNPNCPLKHTFSGKTYVREIFIPKNTLLVGKIHRHEHPNFLMKGVVSVATENGVELLEAPLSMISKAGTKRIVYTHSDTVWITVHEVGEERDLEKIENIVIAETYEELGFDESEKIEEEAELIKLIENVTEVSL